MAARITPITATHAESDRHKKLSLSVLVPVFNEKHLVEASLRRLPILTESPLVSWVEVIVVDDGSTDGTAEVLARLESEFSSRPRSRLKWLFLRHAKNLGKGTAVRTALEHATGAVSVIHDADLEYHPGDLLRIVKVFLDEDADAVFGSRFLTAEYRRALLYRHDIGNKLLTHLCNLVSNLNITDMETCYKAVRTDLLKSIPLRSNDFRLEPELTIKLAMRGARIFEVPINYSGRTYVDGKKVNWRDGFLAILAILEFGLSDDVFIEDEFGSQILHRLGRAPRFNAWMADTIRKYCGDYVLEIGSGVGNITRELVPRSRYVASDINPLYLQTLSSLREDRPYMQISYCDINDLGSFPRTQPGFDTVICLNVLEHVADDQLALRNLREVLAPGGTAIILVPHGPWNFGSLDRILGHQRRYTKENLKKLAGDCGFQIRELIEFNRIGTIAWFLNGKMLKRKTFGLGQVVALNILSPLFRRIDKALPFPSLSLIAILERTPQSSNE